jgi:hypothetical protein
MNQIIISMAGIEDLWTVQQISRETFFETFAEANTEADMKKYLAENFSDEKMRKELSNPESKFFIAWDDKNPAEGRAWLTSQLVILSALTSAVQPAVWLNPDRSCPETHKARFSPGLM